MARQRRDSDCSRRDAGRDRLCGAGLCLVIALALGSARLAGVEMPAAADGAGGQEPAIQPAETAALAGRYAASNSADWQLDAQANYKHLKTLCENHQRHALQELAAIARRDTPGQGSNFSLQNLLQGEGATLDLTAPYQAHVDAAEIFPAQRQDAELIGARQFRLLQKYAPVASRKEEPAARPAGSMHLELTADRAEFGIVAGAGHVATGAARTLGAGPERLRDTQEQMSWPFLVELIGSVGIEFRHSLEPAADVTPAAAAAETAGKMRLTRLRFAADTSHALLAGDRRAGRALFWSTPAPDTAGGDPAVPPRSTLVVEFDNGLKIEVRARRLCVELAWDSASHRTEIRWAGLGAVTVTWNQLPGGKAPEKAAPAGLGYRLTADAIALCSLAGTPGVEPGGETDAFPTTLPQAVDPTLLIAANGRAMLRRYSGAPPAVEGEATATVLAEARFARGLLELGGAKAPAGAGPQLNQGLLRRAWLTQTGLAEPDWSLLDTESERTGYYQPWTVAELQAMVAEFGLSLPIGANRLVLATRWETTAADPAPAPTMVISAERLYLQGRPGGLVGFASGTQPALVEWQDGQRRGQATRVDWQDQSIVLVGPERRVESGVAP